MDHKPTTMELACQIVAAYVTCNAVEQAALPTLIGEVYRALETAATSAAGRDETGEARPHVAISKTITPDYIICLEDGKKFKSLKRHLRTRFGLTPEQYREKWGLPHDYPMVAPNYASSRSALAKNMGLGQRRGK